MKKLAVLLLLYTITYIQGFAYLNGTLWPGKTITLEVNASTGYYSPNWTADNPAVTLSGSGFYRNVTASKYFSGECTIKCTYKWRVGNTEYENSTQWNYDCADNQIEIYPTKMELIKGSSQFISWNFPLQTYISPTIQFTGYDSSIVSVSNTGQVKGLKEGETIIYIRSNLGSNTESCKVKVIDNGSGSDIEPDVPSQIEVVDLGLSVNWASFNLGSNYIYEVGSYFAWGESVPKEYYSMDNSSTFNLSLNYQNGKGIVDIKGNLTKEFDAAYNNWGADWRMPTKEECEELIKNCTIESMEQYVEDQEGNRKYVRFHRATGPNGKSIVFPASGYFIDNVCEKKTFPYIWSSSVCSGLTTSYFLNLSGKFTGYCERYIGVPIRPVTATLEATNSSFSISNDNNLKIGHDLDIIYVKSDKPNIVMIYSSDGKLLSSDFTSDLKIRVSPGLYIVKADVLTRKILIR